MSDLTDSKTSNSSTDADVKPEAVKISGDPILTAILKDVELSLEPTVPIRKLNKKFKDHGAKCFSNLSAIGGVAPRDIYTKFFRRFCTRHGINVGSSSGTKRDCILAIIKAKTDPPKMKEPANKHNKMNRLRRYCKDTGKLPDRAFYDYISPVIGSLTGLARKKRKENSENDFLKEFNTNSKSSKADICMYLIMESILKATHDIRGFTEKKSCLLWKAREEKRLSRTDLKEKFSQYEKS